MAQKRANFIYNAARNLTYPFIIIRSLNSFQLAYSSNVAFISLMNCHFRGTYCFYFQRKYQVERYVKQKERRRNYGVLDLFKTPNLRRKTLIITFIW